MDLLLQTREAASRSTRHCNRAVAAANSAVAEAAAAHEAANTASSEAFAARRASEVARQSVFSIRDQLLLAAEPMRRSLTSNQKSQQKSHVQKITLKTLQNQDSETQGQHYVQNPLIQSATSTCFLQRKLQRRKP